MYDYEIVKAYMEENRFQYYINSFYLDNIELRTIFGHCVAGHKFWLKSGNSFEIGKGLKRRLIRHLTLNFLYFQIKSRKETFPFLETKKEIIQCILILFVRSLRRCIHTGTHFNLRRKPADSHHTVAASQGVIDNDNIIII